MISIKEITEYINEIEKSNDIDIFKLNLVIKQISDLIKENRKNGKVYGIYKGQLLRIKKTKERNEKVIRKTQNSDIEIDKKSKWVAINNGFLKIGHKPGGKKRSFEMLFKEGTTTIFTILSEREGALNIQKGCRNYNIDWIWLSLPNGNIPDAKMNSEIIQKINLLKSKLQNQERIYLHCSAGIHRTGMITNCLLIFLGFDESKSFEILNQLRPITAKEVGQKRLDWGKQFCNKNI